MTTSTYRPNPPQSIVFAILELEELIKDKPTENNIHCLNLLKAALTLVGE